MVDRRNRDLERTGSQRIEELVRVFVAVKLVERQSAIELHGQFQIGRRTGGGQGVELDERALGIAIAKKANCALQPVGIGELERVLGGQRHQTAKDRDRVRNLGRSRAFDHQVVRRVEHSLGVPGRKTCIEELPTRVRRNR